MKYDIEPPYHISLCVVLLLLVGSLTFAAVGYLHQCICFCRNLSMNPIVAIESGAFQGLTDLERL